MPESDLDRIDPVPVRVKLLSGHEYELLRIKTRQFFRLLRILTHGAGERMIRTLDFKAAGEVFTQQLLMLLMLSIPDAEDETIYFIQSMLRPPGLAADAHPGAKLGKEDTEHDEKLWAELSADTFNPEMDDLLTIMEAIVRQEAPEVQALGKKLRDMLAAQFPDLAPLQEKTPSSAATPGPSTPSAETTDGQTT
jgi:hypothetical protein